MKKKTKKNKEIDPEFRDMMLKDVSVDLDLPSIKQYQWWDMIFGTSLFKIFEEHNKKQTREERYGLKKK